MENTEQKQEFKCPYCTRVFKSYNSLAKHAIRWVHKVTIEQLLMDFYYNGERPKCKCGCGGNAPIIHENGYKQFGNYIHGHISRVHNNWGHNPKAIENSSNTRRNQFKYGTRMQWNNGVSWDECYDKETQERLREIYKNPERCKKISEALTGREFSEEHLQKLNIILSKNREKILKNKIYKPEKIICTLLDKLNIQYTSQFLLKNFHYDIYIHDTNILIEIDGDYHHANPKFFDMNNLTKLQKHNLRNDTAKTSTANTKNYNLLRFWEYDIKNSPEQVIQKIKEAIEQFKNKMIN